MKAQSSEWSRVSDSQTDAHLMMKVRNGLDSSAGALSVRLTVCPSIRLSVPLSAQEFVELQMRHWHQRRDFELQQDTRITDALCNLWMVSLCV